VSSETLSILDGNTFVVSDRRGDIDARRDDPTGLFSWDTRFLSRWVLTVDGRPLSVRSAHDTQYFQAQFFLAKGQRPSTSTQASRSSGSARSVFAHQGHHALGPEAETVLPLPDVTIGRIGDLLDDTLRVRVSPQT